MMLCEFRNKIQVSFEKNETVSTVNNSSITTSSLMEQHTVYVYEHSWLEILLTYWVFSIFCDEIRQVSQILKTKKNGFGF
jgi:hypothetical protein